MVLIKLAFAGTAAYALYRYASQQRRRNGHAAFAAGETDSANFAQIRNAGPAGMRGDADEWDKTDEASDESFPASDPPAVSPHVD